MPFTCDHCGQTVSHSKGEHNRICHKIPFTINVHPLSKKGDLVPVTRRDSDGLAICQCVDKEGKICDQVFINKKALMNHIKACGHDEWKVRIFLHF